LKQVFEEIADLISKVVPTEIEIVDSTPLEDTTADAEVGFTSKVEFRGFKANLGVNQITALRAKITKGNEHDSLYFSDLIVESKYILRDKGYDAKSNRNYRIIGVVPVMAININVLWSLLIGAENIREVSRFWY